MAGTPFCGNFELSLMYLFRTKYFYDPEMCRFENKNMVLKMCSKTIFVKSSGVFLHLQTNMYQFGSGILKMVGPKKQDFWPKINILKAIHCILRIQGAPVRQ